MSDRGDRAAKKPAPQPGHKDEIETLRYWLANEDVYTSPYVRNWLERTPIAYAADALAQIASQAQPDSRTPWSLLSRGFRAMFTASEIITEKSPAGRKAGVRAAMLLANLGDVGCLAPLSRVFEPNWYWAGRYQKAIETCLLRFLARELNPEERNDNCQSLLRLAELLWSTGGARADLSEEHTQLLQVLMRQLPSPGTDASDSLKSTIAASRTTKPNRMRVKSSLSQSQ